MSAKLKNEALCWLRYGKKLPIICTEVGFFSCDVLGVGDNLSVEVEVKTSLSDLRREFKSKTAKHYLYANATETSPFVPNYFYFLVPEALEQAALAIVKDNAPKAGLAIYVESGDAGSVFDGRTIRIAQKPTRLKKAKPSLKMISTAVKRMSSELCQSKLAYARMQTVLTDTMDMVVLAGLRDTGTLDCEDEVADMEMRARDLAHAVDGVVWDKLEPTQKQRWLDAAKRYLEAERVKNAQEWASEAFR